MHVQMVTVTLVATIYQFVYSLSHSHTTNNFPSSLSLPLALDPISQCENR